MASLEHIEVVMKGPPAIAQWRRSHPDEFLDLSDADLEHADLSGADLSGAHIEGSRLMSARLVGADLSDANLTHVDLYSANLEAATLVNALLAGCNLGYANLAKANLSGALFTEAYLYHTHLRGAKLQRAYFGRTSVADCDLSGCHGLHKAVHLEESSIAHDTLRASYRGANGKLTRPLKVFFRGAGVPNELLAQIQRILVNTRFRTCFIAHGDPDRVFCEKLRHVLSEIGVTCWLYSTDSTAGRTTWTEITRIRRNAERVIVVCSARSLVRDGLLKEIEHQIDDNPEKIVPISLDDRWKRVEFPVVRGTSDLKPFLLRKNYVHFANRRLSEKPLEKLLRGLQRRA